MSNVYTVVKSELSRTYDVNGRLILDTDLPGGLTISDIIAAGIYALVESGELAHNLVDDLERIVLGENSKLLKAMDSVTRKKRVDTDIFDICASLVRFNPKVTVPNPGAYVIVGKARSGKTTWIDRFTKDEIPAGNNVLYIQQDECEVGEGESLLGIDMLCEALELASGASDINTIVIDSIREIQYEADGTTLPGGVNADFFRMLTRLSNVAKSKGIALFLVYNPQAEKTETYEMVVGMVDGAVHGIVDMNKRKFRSRYLDRKDMDLAQVAESVYSSKHNTTINDAQEISL